MAITTLDGIIAGQAIPEHLFKVGSTMEAIGVLHSLFYTSGMPGAATAPSPGLNGQTLVGPGTPGAIYVGPPVSGQTYLSLLEGTASVAGTLYLCDRIWHNSGITITTTTEQGITSPTWPARDRQGATNGLGVMVGIEVSAACGNGAVSNTTMRYTDTFGNNNQTATMTSFPASAVAGTFVPFQLAAGDVGVKSIQGLTLGTTYVSGTIHLVAYRVIARIGLGPDMNRTKDIFALGKPRIYDYSNLFGLWRPSATTGVTVDVSMAWAQG